MTKKTINYSKEDALFASQSLVHLPGISIIHYTNHNHQPQTLIAHNPKQIIHQTHAMETAAIVNAIKSSPSSYWVIATSYDWGCAQLGLSRPNAMAFFIEYDDVTIVDHQSETATVFGRPHPTTNLKPLHSLDIDLTPLWTRDEFIHAVQTAKSCITEGDIYQLNLSYPATVQGSSSIRDIYASITSQNLPRHGGFVSTDQWTIASASPEEFFYMNGAHIRTRPIKGTVGRHSDPVDDQLAKSMLQQSTKDHAELVMITDLMRNDLGQLAVPGSVRVDDLCELVPFPYVYHLVSTISATLPPHTCPMDAFMAMVPGGSITGCPKPSACKHIQAIENVPRHFYTGHLGFISNKGEASFNVGIRTCYQSANGPIMTHSGCGITIDSNPHDEYQESLDKLRFLTSNCPIHVTT